MMRTAERLPSPLDTHSSRSSKGPTGARYLLLLLAISPFLVSGARAQTDPTRVYGAEDPDIPTPPLRVVLGQQDTGALQELIDHLKAVNFSSWQGLKGTGSYTVSSVDAGNPDQASLAILQGDRFRLDVQTSSGILSTRIAATYGQTIDPQGKRWPMPRATAKLGLLFFPQLLVPTFPSPAMSLIDRGQVQIQGRALHRITVAETLVENQQTSADPARISVVDLYFDTASHLLIKSAASIQIDSADHARYIEVITYDDYRKLQNSQVAYRFHQSLNGQPQWTLQLSNIDLIPDANDSDFYF